MRKNRTKLIIFLGVLSIFLLAVSSWYSITYNEGRIVKPMVLEEYIFRIQDLPMIVSTILLCVYIICLFVLLIRTVIADRKKETMTQSTRTISPKFGFMGFFGFFGFMGFWTYSVDKTIYPFLFFMFFGFFGFFYEGKMSDTFMDERYRENKMKAHMIANRTALMIIFVAVIILSQKAFMKNLEYTLIAIIIVIALSIAAEVFLGEYLLYRYDHDEQLEERGE